MDDGRQWVVIDEHELGRIRRGRSAIGDDDRDHLPDEPDHILRHEGARHAGIGVADVGRKPWFQVDVCGRDDLRALDRARVHAEHSRMGERRADKGDVSGVVQRKVVDVGPATP